MRASRATDLADEYPSHVSATWLGHTEAMADEAYRQVKQEHYDKAVRKAVRAGDATESTESHQPA